MPSHLFFQLKFIMKKYFLFLLPTLVLFSLVALNACKKDDGHHANEATIEISSPTEGQMVMGGATLEIKATLTGRESLHGWKVEIRKQSDNSLVFEADAHDHDLVLNINESWTNNVTEHTNLVLEVFALLDHDGTMTSKKVNFHAHPM